MANAVVSCGLKDAWNRYVVIEDCWQVWRDALKASGLSIVFSNCEWGVYDPRKRAPDIGNPWRAAGNITGGRNCRGVYTRGAMMVKVLSP